ncbi:MAG: glycosyltransferase family 2 protein [Thermoleophilia bacterium]
MNIEDAKVTVAILARNEEATIGSVVDSVAPYADELVVIDGNSTDRTREIVEAMGFAVHADDGGGKGDGIRKAIEVAAGDVLVFIDADGSHDPAEIPKLVAPIKSGMSDLVVGSRWKGGSDELAGDWSKFVRSTGSAVIALCINYRFGVRLTDVENGFRAIRTAAARAIPLKARDFTIEQEMIMLALRQGFRLSEVAAHEYPRQAGQSDLKVYKVLHKFGWNLVKHLIR